MLTQETGRSLVLPSPNKCLLHALREQYVVRLMSHVDERFGFAHQILDVVAPKQMVNILALVHPSEAQYDLDHVAFYSLYWWFHKSLLLGASRNAHFKAQSYT